MGRESLRESRRGLPAAGFLIGLSFAAAAVSFAPTAASAQDAPAPETLGVSGGRLVYDTRDFRLELISNSHTAAALVPHGAGLFDFTPRERLADRASDGYYHLGDLNLRWRAAGDSTWARASTADARAPVQLARVARGVRPVPGVRVFIRGDLADTLPEGVPFRVVRTWSEREGVLTLSFEITNASDRPIELGAVGIPMVFDNILTDRSLEDAHAKNSFQDPYVGLDAGYVQVTRLSGTGPALVVVPLPGSGLEAWNPLLDEKTRRGITFEGFHEWLVHSRAVADEEWTRSEPWNPPTSAVLAPGERRTYGVQFLVAPSIRAIEPTLAAAGRPVAVGVPGYVLPRDVDGRLFLRHASRVRSFAVEPAGALALSPVAIDDAHPDSAAAWQAYSVRGAAWGRARLTVTWEDSTVQTIHYKVIEPAAEVVDALGRFLTTEQWFERADDPFDRSPGIISYDWTNRRQVTEDHRAWIAGLGDEGGSGSWLAAFMKQVVRPDAAELAKLQRFVDETLWGGIQYSPETAPHDSLVFGVRKSMFWWEPDLLPAGTYSDSVRYGGWSSWNREHALSVGRSFNYLHVAAAYWTMYRIARTTEGLVTNRPWSFYLENARQTALAMVRLAPYYAQFGQMEGTVFVQILLDLQREGLAAEAAEMESVMRARAEVWRQLAYPFGSEMPWDSTGQEEVYAWSRYFGFDDKALVTLNAILGYMPTLPHWGYNGSARRYWDFQYAGHPATSRVERQLHHYGSGMNALPVLAEYRRSPGDLHLLRVGYGGLLGAIANVTREGFGPAAFHAWPSTLDIDGFSGDYGPNFFGHAMNTGAYVTRDDRFGWLGFGAAVGREGDVVVVRPNDSARQRVFLAPIGLWLTLDAGTFDRVEWNRADGSVLVHLSPGPSWLSQALLRAESTPGFPSYRPDGEASLVRGAWAVPAETLRLVPEGAGR